MNKLIQTIEMLRGKLDGLRRHSLKETPTRTIIIDPLLEALDWDVRDPDEVQLEYPTVDGKSVDYALKINGQPVLLVEAKALDDPLDDVKAITQIVGYAANDGIFWCVLTNGVKWKVYRGVENGLAPYNLMFEVSLDPREPEGVSVQQLAQQMWRFSRDEIAKGSLDALGEQTFTDGKVRKALDAVLRDPPSQLLDIVRTAIGDEALSTEKIRESLTRLRAESAVVLSSLVSTTIAANVRSHTKQTDRSQAARMSWETRRLKETPTAYDELYHVSGKPQVVLELYRAVDRLCLSLKPGSVRKRYLAKYISYSSGNKIFCNVHVHQGGLRVWLYLKYGRLEAPPFFARDVSTLRHWCAGDLELDLNNISQLDEAALLIRWSFEARIRVVPHPRPPLQTRRGADSSTSPPLGEDQGMG